MDEISGFKTFWVYMVLKKFHLTDNNYNIMERRLINKDNFIKSWNSTFVNSFGRSFKMLETSLPKDKFIYIKFFSYYLVENPDISVTEILLDSKQKFVKYEHELNNLSSIIELDFVKCFDIVKNHNKSIKDIFFSFSETSLPPIFKLYEQERISIHSLIAFNLAFKFFQKVNRSKLNIIERNLYDKYMIIFNKYYKIIYKYYINLNLKEILTIK